MRNIVKNWALGTALVVGLLGTGAVAANAAGEFHGRPEARFDGRNGRVYGRPVERGWGFGHAGYGVAYGGPVAENYIPPCPGEGYIWTAGYYNGGYWVPGEWVFRGNRGYGYVGGYGFDRDRHYDRNEFRDEHRREDWGRDNRGRDDRGGNRGDGRMREGGFNRGGRPQR